MTKVIEWAGSLADIFDVPLSRDVYYAWVPGEDHPWIAHVCRRTDGWGWQWAGTGLHTVISREPLHLEASIGWMACCGRHGWIRNGQWEPCPPDEGFSRS